MKAVGHYDSELQMFVEEPREVDISRLRFFRRLAELGQLEHEVAGEPCGAFAIFHSSPNGENN